MPEFSDTQLRLAALEGALKTANPSDDPALFTTEAIVKRADAFYDFLTGDKK